MRIVFVGATRFGLRCLEMVTDLLGCALACVITAPHESQDVKSPRCSAQRRGSQDFFAWRQLKHRLRVASSITPLLRIHVLRPHHDATDAFLR
jgi:hypothetical protein